MILSSQPRRSSSGDWSSGRRRYAIILILVQHIVSTHKSLHFLQHPAQLAITLLEQKVQGLPQRLQQLAPLSVSHYFEFGDPFHKNETEKALKSLNKNWGICEKKDPPLTNAEIDGIVSDVYSSFSKVDGPSCATVQAVLDAHPFSDRRCTSPEPLDFEHAAALRHAFSTQDSNNPPIPLGAISLPQQRLAG